MKLEEVIQAYREGKTIIYGNVKFNINANNNSGHETLACAYDFQITGNNWKIEKVKVKKYPVLLQRSAEGGWLPEFDGGYLIPNYHRYKDFEEAQIYYRNHEKLWSPIRLITEIPELIREEEV